MTRWELARREAKRLVAPLDPTLKGWLADDTFDALALEGFDLRFRPEQPAGQGCSVDGSYSEGPPPTITVAEALSVRRRRFSALHEYGHHLVRLDKTIHDLFADYDDGGEGFEEDVCDAVAAELLLPDDLVDRFIGDRGPTARSVLELFQASNASREAACVRAAQRLLGEGYVMLGQDDLARFTATVGTAYRVARDVRQGPDSILAQAARRGTARGQGRPRFRTGNEGPQLFADAVADAHGYVFAVLTDSPAWEDFTVRDPDEIFDEHEGTCWNCEIDFTTYRAPCQRCGQPFCWRCGKCWCEAPTQTGGGRYCEGCTFTLALTCFEGDSTVCKDCTG